MAAPPACLCHAYQDASSLQWHPEVAVLAAVPLARPLVREVAEEREQADEADQQPICGARQRRSKGPQATQQLPPEEEVQVVVQELA